MKVVIDSDVYWLLLVKEVGSGPFGKHFLTVNI
jgi:hypothetical protein